MSFSLSLVMKHFLTIITHNVLNPFLVFVAKANLKDIGIDIGNSNTDLKIILYSDKKCCSSKSGKSRECYLIFCILILLTLVILLSGGFVINYVPKKPIPYLL
ncbi:hypothetical protein Anas_10508 [Armadillidium nasatum]|uniref:Uncharacterized protein n=1 Tax=Armadillidium nasatum TaxID=96803 RepID=A0A5N5T9X3_9CRUS|nr:hypothetical protein Anas_10508 [Armadillidium nasatum]